MNKIILKATPYAYEQQIYVFTEDTEKTPITITSNIDEMFSEIAMAAAKYNIKDIAISGAKSYTEGIRNQLTEKINTCFGKSNNFNIELM